MAPSYIMTAVCRDTALPRSRAYHFFDNMVGAHCVRDEVGFTVQWLAAFHWVRVRARVYTWYNSNSMPTMSSKKR